MRPPCSTTMSDLSRDLYDQSELVSPSSWRTRAGVVSDSS